MTWLGTVFSLLCIYWQRIWQYLFNQKALTAYGRRKRSIEDKGNSFPFHPPKPEWVKKEVIHLKAMMPNDGHRKIAATFNRLYTQKRNMTVGPTFVGYTISDHLYEIQVLRRKIKHKRPRPVPKHLIWAMDLTGKTDNEDQLHHLLGIVEHQSRACLTLAAIRSKSSITLLRCLLDLIERYNAKPKFLRTDNEAVFTSYLFRFGMWLLGISHQRIENSCPWQNGKIERFFGTLKEKLNQWEINSFESLNHSLHLFRFWYNHIRPHQYLDGLTPAEVWQGKTDFNRQNNKIFWFDEWDGLLRGFYLPP